MDTVDVSIGQSSDHRRRKVYVDAARAGIRVPFVEVTLADSPGRAGPDQQPGDPALRHLGTGVGSRGGASGPTPCLDRRPFGRRRVRGAVGQPAGRRARQTPATPSGRPSTQPRPGAAAVVGRSRDPDALCPPGRDHAGDELRGHSGRRTPRPGARRAGRWPRHPPVQRQPPRVRADDHRQPVPGEGQRQHRQFGGQCVHRGRGGEADLGHPVGSRHGDGPVHRPADPHHPGVDPAELAGPHRNGAHLPGPGEGRRSARGADLGALPGHPRRAGRAGCRLLHRPCRRPAPLRAAHGPAGHRHRQSGRLDHGRLVPRPSHRELPLHPVRGDLRDHGRL